MQRTPVRAILSLLAATVSVSSVRAGDVEFQVLGGADTGLRSAMEAWRRAELVRQGGKFGSHGWWPWGLRAFDYDNDGDLDLLPSHHGIPRSLVLKSLLIETGRLSFADVTKGLGIDSRALPAGDDRPWIWDFNGDGFLDIAALTDEGKAVSVLNRGGKGFSVIAGFTFSPLSHPKEVVDLNGDGHPDLDGGYRGRWLYDPGEGIFRRDERCVHEAPAEVRAVAESIVAAAKETRSNRFLRAEHWTHAPVGYDTLGYSPTPIDLNGDGRGDVVLRVAGAYGADYFGRYFLRIADGKLADGTKESGLPEVGAPIAIEDLTGDGRPEVLIVGKATGGLYVNDGRGRFVRKAGEMSAFLTRRGPYLLRAFRADLDNDSDWDLVMSNPRLGRMEVHENKGGGAFKRIMSARAWDSNPVVVCDIDNDGRMDVVAGGPGAKEDTDITIYLNRTKSPGGFCKVSPRMASPNPFAVGAVVEAYGAGTLGRKGASAFFIEKAHADGTAVHIGLGRAGAFDLRVRFPNAAAVSRTNVPAGKRLTITPGSADG
ncbi:MAG: VCBS repeat-containing protein [Phycisphaerae bacterium]